MTKREPKDDRTVTTPGTFDDRSRSESLPSTARLGALASFAELGATLLSDIETSMIERSFPAGSALMKQGEAGDCLVVVQEGEVEVSVQVGEERHVLKRAGAGEVFGEMALLSGQPRSADVTALDYSTFAVLSGRDFRQLLRKYPDIRAQLTHLAVQREASDRQVLVEGPPPETPQPS